MINRRCRTLAADPDALLVIFPDRFNQLTGVPVVLPITTGGSFARTADIPSHTIALLEYFWRSEQS